MVTLEIHRRFLEAPRPQCGVARSGACLATCPARRDPSSPRRSAQRGRTQVDSGLQRSSLRVRSTRNRTLVTPWARPPARRGSRGPSAGDTDPAGALAVGLLRGPKNAHARRHRRTRADRAPPRRRRDQPCRPGTPPRAGGGPTGVWLGQGGGYYDRSVALVAEQVPRVVIISNEELVDELPAEPHDRRVTGALLPSGLVPLSREK